MSNIKVSSDVDTMLKSADNAAILSNIGAASLATVGSLANEVSTNTSNIATNASDIATNASNIATNTFDISSLTSSLVTNTTNIATNTSNIATKAPTDSPKFTGDVGIGTTTPSNRLEVREDIDNDYVVLKLNNEGDNGGASVRFNEGATTYGAIFYPYDRGRFIMKNGHPNGVVELQTENSSGVASAGLIVYGNSNVGIPNGDLTVNGKIITNQIQGTGSVQIGSNDIDESVNSLAVGSQNTINGNFSLVVGIQNTTHRSGNYALGDRNEVGNPTLVAGGNSTAIGSDNILKGGNSFIAGNDNSLTEAGTNEFVSSSIIGNLNNISGSRRAFIVGQNNTITNADDAIAIGKSSLIEGNNSIGVGTGLKDFADNNTVIFGRFNQNPRAASKIVIGAGFSDTARYNAIEIESKGESMKARSKLIFRSLFDTNSYSSDSEAQIAGVEFGELYRDGNTVKIRMT